jgi:hypothetical protein
LLFFMDVNRFLLIFLLNASLYVIKLYNQNNLKLYFKEQQLFYSQLILTLKNVEFFPFPVYVWSSYDY